MDWPYPLEKVRKEHMQKSRASNGHNIIYFNKGVFFGTLNFIPKDGHISIESFSVDDCVHKQFKPLIKVALVDGRYRSIVSPYLAFCRKAF